jgi:hypothetical protein
MRRSVRPRLSASGDQLRGAAVEQDGGDGGPLLEHAHEPQHRAVALRPRDNKLRCGIRDGVSSFC